MGHARTTLLLFILFCLLAVPSPAVADFGISTFTIAARDADGTIAQSAASHPFALDIHLAVNRLESGEPDGALHTILIDLPPGFLGNAPAIPSCPPDDFVGESAHCEGATQVGILRGVLMGLGQITIPVYNLTPSPGYAAAFGGLIEGHRFVEQLKLAGSGAGGATRLTATLPLNPAIVEVEEEIWGVPADPAHDPARTCRGPADAAVGGCAIGAEVPFLTLPASCAEPMQATLTATSYGPAPLMATATAVARDTGGNPLSLLGCEDVPFDPQLTVATETAALAPTALTVGLAVPQHEGVGLSGSAPVSALEIELPKGLALNPSAGSWLGGCSPAQIGLESASGVEPAAFDESAAECPASARLGSVTLQTPLVDHDLSGAIYLATPAANPFAARFAIYLALEDEATGTILKIPGRLGTDAADGRLTAVVPELPSLPFSQLELEFAGGPRAPLVDPPGCGRYTTEATFTPTTTPFAPALIRSSSFTVSTGAFGAQCPPPEPRRNATPAFQVGTGVLRAGDDSPLVIQLSREVTDQHFGSFDLTLPPGLIADLGSVSVGAPLGSARVDAGLGSPLALEGTVYLGGPYKGAPYSLDIVVPAQAGPFDLGTIVQRAALEVDPVTAQISVRSDTLPQILEGVPLELRSLELDLDRLGFVRNPTSCEPMAITGTATTSLGQTAPLSDRFQVGGCAALAFKPKAALRFSGRLQRNGHPALRAVLRSGSDEADIAAAAFTLPAGELLDLQHVRGLCAQGVGAERCPPSSRLGRLRLVSPFLEGPAEGSVYLLTPSHRLPELLAEVRSGPLRFVLHGRTFIRKGHFGVSFPAIPDIPLSRAALSLDGARRGLFVNSRSLCSGVGMAEASLSAHSGKRRLIRLRPRTVGC